MTPQAARYLDLALTGRNEWWRYALGAIVIFLSWLVLGYAPYFLIAALVPDYGPLLDFVVVNFSILMMLAGLAFTVQVIHGRTLRSLVTPHDRIDWVRMGRGALCWLALAAAISLAEHLLFPERYYLSFNAERFPAWLAAVLLMTPLQCLTEELVFRGYAMQGFARLFRRPAVIAVASSAVFTAPHLLNPEVAEHGVLLMAANYFVIGLLLATVTLRDGRLELAIGVHAVNNVFLALLANYEGSALATEAVYTARELDPVYSLVSLLAAAAAFHAWMFRRTSKAYN